MTAKLTCPVCDRPDLETNICPNCETDLSTIRMLNELPIISNQSNQSNKSKQLFMLIFISLIIAVLVIGSLGGYLVAQNSFKSTLNKIVETDKLSIVTVVNEPMEQPEEEKDCGGFYYRIKSGDSLSLIALKFYGDSNAWDSIIQANSQLQSPDMLNINDIILIPNLKEYCYNK